jgi:ATP-binding cassette subfamily B protein
VTDRQPGLARNLARLANGLSPERRAQAMRLAFLIAASAVVELLTLAAVVAFIAAMAGAEVRPPRPLAMIHAGPVALPTLAAVFAACALAAGAVRLLLNRAGQAFAFAVGQELGVAVYARTLAQPYRAHLDQNPSDAIAGVTKVQMLIWQALIPLISGASAAVIAVAIFVGLLFIAPLVAMVCAGVLLCAYLAVTRLTAAALRRNSACISQGQTDRVQTLREGLGGIREVITGDLQSAYVEAFSRIEERLRRAQAANAFLTTTPRFVIEAVAMALVAAVAALLGARSGGVMGVLPVLGAVLFGAQRLLPLAQQVYVAWAQLSGAGQSIRDVLSLLDRPAARPAADGEAVPFRTAITLVDVGFAYGPGLPPVLDGVDLVIPKGARIGVVGRTGSGKSTLLDLVTGLIEPSRGEIRVDGRPLTAARVSAWRRQIAYVSQHVFLADATVAENIAFGVERARIDETRLRLAAAVAGLDEVVAGLARGFDTRVGDRGARLSGGQRQRIGIARAIYKGASVLVFDEATSALDDDTEAAILRAMEDLAADATVIMIAHRKGSLAGCDQIWRLAGGKLTPVAGAPI